MVSPLIALLSTGVGIAKSTGWALTTDGNNIGSDPREDSRLSVIQATTR